MTRLSRDTDTTTSPDTQRARVAAWAALRGAVIVDEVEDLGVSGYRVSPFDRPDLGPWLTDNPPQPWDVLVAVKLDRVSRNAADALYLVEWLDKRGKHLVTTDDSIDTSKGGRLYLTILAAVAEAEWEAISARTRVSRRQQRLNGKWNGEKPPYGYAPHDTGQGWVLVVDDAKAATVRAMFGEAAKGATFASIARQFGMKETTVADMIRNPAYVGKTRHSPVVKYVNGRAVRGKPVTIDSDKDKCAPIVSASLWEQANKNRGDRKGRARKESPVLRGVVSCMECGENLWGRRQTVAGKVYEYMYCPNKHLGQLRVDTLIRHITAQLLQDYGPQPVTEQHWVAGNSVAEQQAHVRNAIDAVRSRLTTLNTPVAHTAALDALTALDQRARALSSQTATVGHWENRPTGVTWAQLLANATPQQVREACAQAHLTAVVGMDDETGARTVWLHTNAMDDDPFDFYQA